jgi:pyruvate/2-oxoglutarate dehydrogenase complex dihydrolipoamide dehydrogenase (E3) component
MLNCKFLIIGSGESGLYLSKALAIMGYPTIMIEQDSFGGSYIHNREIPKLWLQTESQKFSNSLEILGDYYAIHKTLLKHRQQYSQKIQEKITQSYNYFLQDYQTTPNLKILNANASFFSKNLIEISANNEKDFIAFDQLIICVGCNILEKPKLLAGLGERYLTQHNIYLCQYLPEKLMILEINPESMQVAEIYANLGFPVLVVEPNSYENCLPYMDIEAKEYLIESLQRKKVEFIFSIIPEEVKETENEVLIKHGGGVMTGSHIYFNTKEKFKDYNLGLTKIGISHNFNGIQTDKSGRTGVNNVWAFGECNTNNNYMTKQPLMNDFLSKLKSDKNKTGVISALLKDETQNFGYSLFECLFDVSGGVIQLGLTQKRAKAIFYPDIEVEYVQKTEKEGFGKIIYRRSTGVVISACLGGEICKSYSTLARTYINKGMSAIELIKIMNSY